MRLAAEQKKSEAEENEAERPLSTSLSIRERHSNDNVIKWIKERDQTKGLNNSNFQRGTVPAANNNRMTSDRIVKSKTTDDISPDKNLNIIPVSEGENLPIAIQPSLSINREGGPTPVITICQIEIINDNIFVDPFMTSVSPMAHHEQPQNSVNGNMQTQTTNTTVPDTSGTLTNDIH